MYLRLHKFGVRLVFGVAVLLLFSQIVIRFDPYQLAARPMRQALTANPELPQRLSFYGEEAARWQQDLHLETAASVAPFIDNSPLFWNLLLELADGIMGGRLLLEGIDQLAHKIAAFNDDLTRLSIAPMANPLLSQLNAGYDLQSDEFVLLNSINYEAASGLDHLSEDLTTLARDIRQVTTAPEYTGLIAELDSWPIDTSVFVDGLVAWQNMPVHFERTAFQMERDAATLHELQYWYRLAYQTESTLNTLYIPQAATWLAVHTPLLLMLISGGIAVAIGGWLGAGMLEEGARLPTFNQEPVVRLANRRSQQRPTLQPRAARHPLHQQQQMRQTAVSHSTNPQPRLICYWHNGQQFTLPLTAGYPVTFGSHQNNSIRTRVQQSAVRQGVVRKARTRYFLEVVDTAYPTRLNGQIVCAAKSLESGDEIQIGGITAVYAESPVN